MANIKSQKKRIVTNEKARKRNRAIRSELKTSIRRVHEAVQAKDGASAYAAGVTASQLLDKAASKGIIHKNQAANRKSGVMKLVNSIATDEDRAAYEKSTPKPQKTGSKKAARKAERLAAYQKTNEEKEKRKKTQAAHDAKGAKRKAAQAQAEKPAEEAAE